MEDMKVDMSGAAAVISAMDPSSRAGVRTVQPTLRSHAV
jgi:leucyl aminopeptidase